MIYPYKWKYNMIDPRRITNFNLNDQELQEHMLFAISVAGKNAMTMAKLLIIFWFMLRRTNGKDCFECVLRLSKRKKPLSDVLKSFGFGCHTNKSDAFKGVAESGLDLRECTTDDLEKIKGIGLKTSRYFIMHTRPDCELACLDTHSEMDEKTRI